MIDFLETSIDKTLKLHNEIKQSSKMFLPTYLLVSGSFKKQVIL